VKDRAGGDFIMANERFINARRKGFTIVQNNVWDDPNLRLEAKALLAILLSNKDDWKISMKEIIKRSKNGRDAHYSAMNELIKEGYVFRLQIKEKGKFKEVIYIFSDDKEEVKEAVKELEAKGLLPHPENQETDHSPLPENPYTENPDPKKPDPENQDNNNTNRNNTKENNTTSRYVGNDQSPQPEDQPEADQQTTSLQTYIINRFAEVYKLTGYAKQKLIELMKVHGELLVSEALERTINAETDRPIAYIKGILKKWSSADLQTKEDIEEFERKFYEEKEKQKRNKQNKGKKRQTETKGEQLPRAVQMQLKREQQRKYAESISATYENNDNKESLAEKRERINRKLAEMRNRLSQNSHNSGTEG